MKKVLLTSALVMSVVASASANRFDGNPLYRPLEGQWVSDTTIMTNTGTEAFKGWGVGTSLEYGITDRLSVTVATGAAMFDMFDETHWGTWGAGLSFRALDNNGLLGDVYGAITRTTMSDWWQFDNGDLYTWTIGTRIGGEVAPGFTLAGFAEYTYIETDFLRWDRRDNGVAGLALGVMGQYLIDNNWNVTGQFAYVPFTRAFGSNDFFDSRAIDMTLAVNYNFTDTMFTGLQVGRTIMLDDMFTEMDEWTLGARFGVQF
ncbi:MAG: hypothetical protein FWC83_02800 [Alphaproteobacteria bacterium]|nr:hypothetical protein [Alphaproteobacteria bacterium]